MTWLGSLVYLFVCLDVCVCVCLFECSCVFEWMTFCVVVQAFV